MILKTPRLTLRGVRPADLEDLFEVFSDPEVMRYWSTPAHSDPSQTLDRMQAMMARFDSHPAYFCLEYNGRAIGCAGLVPQREVGFILHRAFHRQGLMGEAMQAILTHIWQSTPLDHLTADADPRNDASISLLKSLGFAETHRAENTFFINGEWCHSVYFALQRPT